MFILTCRIEKMGWAEILSIAYRAALIFRFRRSCAGLEHQKRREWGQSETQCFLEDRKTDRCESASEQRLVCVLHFVQESR